MRESAAEPAVADHRRSALAADGYVVVPTGLPVSILEAVVDDIWRHAGAAPDDPATWYQPAIIRPRPGMVEMYHYQSMWDVRQHPAVYEIFRELHGTDELWVSIDRVALKPPARPDQPDYDQPGFIHWDTDINRYPDIPFRLQGVLALKDTSADMGGFQCVPSIYRDQRRFLDERSTAGPVPRAPDIGGHPIVKVPLAAGDLVIWKTTLLHGNGRNSAQRPRLAQYLCMNPLPPAGSQRETVRRERIISWSTCAPPDSDAFPGDPRRIEEQRGEPASLGSLGRRLLGLDEWPLPQARPDRLHPSTRYIQVRARPSRRAPAERRHAGAWRFADSASPCHCWPRSHRYPGRPGTAAVSTGHCPALSK